MIPKSSQSTRANVERKTTTGDKPVKNVEKKTTTGAKPVKFEKAPSSPSIARPLKGVRREAKKSVDAAHSRKPAPQKPNVAKARRKVRFEEQHIRPSEFPITRTQAASQGEMDELLKQMQDDQLVTVPTLEPRALAPSNTPFDEVDALLAQMEEQVNPVWEAKHDVQTSVISNHLFAKAELDDTLAKMEQDSKMPTAEDTQKVVRAMKKSRELRLQTGVQRKKTSTQARAKIADVLPVSPKADAQGAVPLELLLDQLDGKPN